MHLPSAGTDSRVRAAAELTVKNFLDVGLGFALLELQQPVEGEPHFVGQVGLGTDGCKDVVDPAQRIAVIGFLPRFGGQSAIASRSGPLHPRPNASVVPTPGVVVEKLFGTQINVKLPVTVKDLPGSIEPLIPSSNDR